MIRALIGPTASGKTAVSLELAEALDAEIVCVDSMTVYRGMDVGTAKPDATARARVPHHLVDVVDPGHRLTAAAFQDLAARALAAIEARNRDALVVGGSGLYFRAAVDALAFPPADAAVRARLEALPHAEAQRLLATRDPEAAGFIDARNHRRVIRALEVIELTGRPFSSFRDAWARYGDLQVAGLRVEPDVLRARIDARLRSMLEQGFLDEVRALVDAGFAPWLRAVRAIGYLDALRVIDGELDEAGFLEAAARATRRLARRQMSWFRRDPRVHWFDASDLGRAAAEIRAYYGETAGE